LFGDTPLGDFFSRTLDGQSTRIWHVQIPAMAKIQSNIAKMQHKKQGVQHLDFLDKPIIVCYSSPAFPPMGVTPQAQPMVDSVPFRRLRREITLRNGRFLNDQRIQTAFLDVHPSEYLVKNHPGNIP